MGLMVGDVVERLEVLEPFDCAAVQLYREIIGGESALSRYTEIEEALRESGVVAGKVGGMVRRCCEMQARPARKVPLGF